MNALSQVYTPALLFFKCTKFGEEQFLDLQKIQAENTR